MDQVGIYPTKSTNLDAGEPIVIEAFMFRGKMLGTLIHLLMMRTRLENSSEVQKSTRGSRHGETHWAPHS